MNTRKLTSAQSKELIETLKARFENNMHRHEGFGWAEIQTRLETNTEALWSLNEMEKSGGEPDIVGCGLNATEYMFYDCSPESPVGRRNCCYDNDALESRKKNRPENSAVNMAAFMGIELLTEERYRMLQEFGEFDVKTSSWVVTPTEIRKLGGAIFCDRRYNHVFTYHNGAESYYSVRGFRGSIEI